MNDDSVKTVVYKSQQAAKQFAEVFHRSSPPSRSPPSLVLTTRSWIRRPVGINTWMILPPGRWVPIPGASKFQISFRYIQTLFLSNRWDRPSSFVVCRVLLMHGLTDDTNRSSVPLLTWPASNDRLRRHPKTQAGCG